MRKEYRAHSAISMNIILPSGKSAHASFDALTGGGRMYVTDSAAIQQGLESHPRFGKMFKLVKVGEDKPVEKVESKVESREPAPKIATINVASLEDAKNYLVETFGISRTKLRSRKAIEDAGAANNVEFNFQ